MSEMSEILISGILIEQKSVRPHFEKNCNVKLTCANAVDFPLLARLVQKNSSMDILGLGTNIWGAPFDGGGADFLAWP